VGSKNINEVKLMLIAQRLLIVASAIARSMRSICAQRDAARFEYYLGVASGLVAFFGVLTAAHSQHPLFWLLVWPVPTAVVYTIFILVRQGIHIEDGVIVFGRRTG